MAKRAKKMVEIQNLKISWDKHQWIVDYDSEPTIYFSSLGSMYKWMTERRIKELKGLVSKKNLDKALQETNDLFQKTLAELCEALDVSRQTTE